MRQRQKKYFLISLSLSRMRPWLDTISASISTSWHTKPACLDGRDTILLARRFLPGLKRFKLDMVAAHLKIQTINRHRALGDAEVTAAVFLRMLEIARQQGIKTLGHLRLRVQLPVAWSGDITQAAVSEKGKLWSDDGKLTPAAIASSRPNGSLFLDPAKKRDFPTKPGV